jgi:hypothetical protein
MVVVLAARSVLPGVTKGVPQTFFVNSIGIRLLHERRRATCKGRAYCNEKRAEQKKRSRMSRRMAALEVTVLMG